MSRFCIEAGTRFGLNLGLAGNDDDEKKIIYDYNQEWKKELLPHWSRA